jgi:hypothetical protein
METYRWPLSLRIQCTYLVNRFSGVTKGPEITGDTYMAISMHLLHLLASLFTILGRGWFETATLRLFWFRLPLLHLLHLLASILGIALGGRFQTAIPTLHKFIVHSSLLAPVARISILASWFLFRNFCLLLPTVDSLPSCYYFGMLSLLIDSSKAYTAVFDARFMI